MFERTCELCVAASSFVWSLWYLIEIYFFSYEFADSNYHVTQPNVNYPQSVPPQAPAHQISERQIGVRIE